MKYTVGAAALWVSLAALGHVPPSTLQHSTAAQAVAVLVVAVIGTWLWGARKDLGRWLASPPLANMLLAVLLFATAVGTVVLQGLPDEKFREKYGAGAGFLHLIGADSIFHSLAYRGFLALLSISLVAVLIRRKAWRPSEWGFMLSHGGVVIILIGGIIGGVWGMKGFIDLHEGRSARTMLPKDDAGNFLPGEVPLGFALRLDKFEIERYPLEYRFYVHEPDEKDYRMASSTPVGEAGKWTPIGKSGISFRMLATYPDYQVRTEVRESAGPEGTPTLQLRTGDGRPVNLLAGVQGRDVLDLRGSKSLIRFVWEMDERNPPVTAESKPEVHEIEFRSAPGVPPEEKIVKPGDTCVFADGAYELDVLAWFPDYVYDKQTKGGGTRSTQPNNPALKISLKSPMLGDAHEMWLFSLRPDFTRDHHQLPPGLEITYRYTPPSEPADRELVVVGRTMEVLDYRRGVLAGRALLKTGGEGAPIADLADLRCVKVSERAIEIHTPVTRSNEWRNPAAEIEIRSGGEVHREFVLAGMKSAMRFGDAGPVLVFDRKPDDVKAFRSRVSVVEDGKTVQDATISVNNPLSYRGYRFYQSNFRKEDPTYSGILVVKDPGLSVVYLGFVMISAGVVFIFYVRPRIIEAKSAARRTTP